MTPRINIVYVRGTVGRLLPYFETLLEYTDFDFTLVSNGCTRAEQHSLASAGGSGDRVHLRIESTDETLDHGEVLDRLLVDETSPYFCFMDSDVLASGPMSFGELLPTDDEAATCSCLPIWHRQRDTIMPDDFEIADGRFLRTERGDFIGCTYAAAYRTDELRGVLDRWDIRLEQSTWDTLSLDARAELERRGFKCRVYDTAKVANLLLQSPDRPMVFRTIPTLVHVGGQSGLVSSGATMRARLRQLVWSRTPTLYGLLWRKRGYSREESDSLADLARRRGELVRVIDRVTSGEMALEDRPRWFDESDFHAVAGVAARGRSGQSPVAGVQQASRDDSPVRTDE